MTTKLENMKHNQNERLRRGTVVVIEREGRFKHHRGVIVRAGFMYDVDITHDADGKLFRYQYNPIGPLTRSELRRWKTREQFIDYLLSDEDDDEPDVTERFPRHG